MNRIIKFRIWDDTLKVLYTPEINEEIKDLWRIPALYGGIMKVNDDINVMQFTGFKDKNGKEIYEGDIVKYIGNNNGDWFTEVVEFSQGGYNPIWDINIMSEFQECKLEVIGNIYENPELIKQDNELAH